MSPQQPTSEPTAPDAARLVRDRLLSALLAETDEKQGRLVLCHDEPEVAVLFATNTGLRIVVLTPGPGVTAEALRAWLSERLRRAESFGPVSHLIVVGRGPEVAQELQRSLNGGLSAERGYYYLGESGDLARLGVVELPMIIRAAYARDTVQPRTPSQFAAALAEGQALQQSTRQAATGLRGSYQVTAVITALCVVLMGLELLWMGAGRLTVFAAMGANSGLALQQGEVWRLFASAFLHGDIFHLIVNMLALWSFGLALESLLGARRYLLLYGLSALGGSLASALLGPNLWSVGASGAIWGLMTAGIAIAYWPRDLLPPAVAADLRRRGWLPLIFNVVYSLQPGIDVYAHLGGGVVGFVLIAVFLTRGLKPVAERTHAGDAERGPTPGLTAAAGVVGLVMAASVVVALALGRPWQLDAPLVFERAAIGATGFSVELPERIAQRLTVSDGAAFPVHTFGQLPDSPVAFEFIVITINVAPQDIEAFLENERQALDKVAPPDFTRVAPAERVTIGDRQAVSVEYRVNDLSLRVYVLVLDGHEVLIRRFVLGPTPGAWTDVEERAVTSVSLAP